MSLVQHLAEYISACFTGLWIESHEHEDALIEIAQLCREHQWRLATWDIAQGLQIPGQNGEADAGGSDPLSRDPIPERLGRTRQLCLAGAAELSTAFSAARRLCRLWPGRSCRVNRTARSS